MRATFGSLLAHTLTAIPLLLVTRTAPALEPIEELGKNIFFMTYQYPAISCHDLAKGGILPDSKVNNSTVVAPGAAPHAVGNIKAPTNIYATFMPPFRTGNFGPVPPYEGGNFWDGRAEGYGAPDALGAPLGDEGVVSDTITVADLGANTEYAKYLGPTADQALNPFPNAVEQNIRMKNVCQQVKTAKYKNLFATAYGAPIDCSTQPKGNEAYKASYKLIAVALAAYQASSEVNSFSSKRDVALQNDDDDTPGQFPLKDLSGDENVGHDLFYGKAGCSVCHNGVPDGESPDPNGTALHQLYADSRYHNIGVPWNPEIPGVRFQEKVGLKAHVPSEPPGHFKTPTVRNVAKGTEGGFIKAYFHNGFCKSLECVVQFYNTRDVLPRCETMGFANATPQQAADHGCWPAPEFTEGLTPGFIAGALGLTDTEEAQLVAYMKALSDQKPIAKP
jgi:cytochrome c peroxidase